MRYATFSLPSDRVPRFGVVAGDRVVDVSTLDPSAPRSLLELIQRGPEAWRAVAKRAGAVSRATSYAAADVRWHAPIPRPTKNVFCLGRNYADHVKEAAKARGQEFKLPAHPVFFTKTPTTVVGPFDDIEWDRRV